MTPLLSIGIEFKKKTNKDLPKPPPPPIIKYICLDILILIDKKKICSIKIYMTIINMEDRVDFFRPESI